MSKRVLGSEVYLNGLPITDDVVSVEVLASAGKLTTAKVELFVASITTIYDDEGDPVKLVYNLGLRRE